MKTNVKKKRYTAHIEIGRILGEDDHWDIFFTPVRVLGINKKTGKVWIKRAGFMTTCLIDASEVTA